MEDTVITVEELKNAWQNLEHDVKKDGKIKTEAFYPTFSKTYALLSQHKSEKALDKSLVELIAQAYLFANIKDEKLDNTCLAAFVLTERMLAYCAFNSSFSTAEVPTIYLADARREVALNFSEVDDTILRLTKVFEDIYWKKLNA